MEKVKWGIISTALIGTKQVIPAMQRGELCDIVAIASRDLAKAEKEAAELGIPKAYGSYEELLADPEIEAVYNPLPNHLHIPVSVQAADAGKHVLCEKPIALTADDIRPLVEARDRNRVHVWEAFMVRHHPQWERVRDLVQGGEIGEVRAVQGFFSYYNDNPDNIRNMADIGGGGIYDIGCYPTVTSRFVLGHEPTQVVSLVDRDPSFGTDRLASAILDFGNGVRSTFTCSTQLVAYQRMQFFGTKGRVAVEIPFNAPHWGETNIYIDDGSKLGDQSQRVEVIPATNQYANQGDRLSETIRGGTPPAYELEDSVKQAAVLDALFGSEETGSWEQVLA